MPGAGTQFRPRPPTVCSGDFSRQATEVAATSYSSLHDKALAEWRAGVTLKNQQVKPIRQAIDGQFELGQAGERL